ncbi:MAG: hypothetical protein ACRCYB_12730 [Aeromonas veronii]
MGHYTGQPHQVAKVAGGNRNGNSKGGIPAHIAERNAKKETAK